MKKLQVQLDKGQIFEKKYLEIFTRTSPFITFIYYGSILFFFLYLNYTYTHNSVIVSAAIYLSALVFWTLFEYLMHRYLFHFINEKKWSKKFHYTVHGVHHQYPRDEQRLFMPPLPGTLIISIVFAFFYLILGKYSFIWMAGFINGWGIYVAIHYILHVYQPVKPFKILWTHHAKHHYKDHNKAFGVSSPLWDYVFGTIPD